MLVVFRKQGTGCRFFGSANKRYKLFWDGAKERVDSVSVFVA